MFFKKPIYYCQFEVFCIFYEISASIEQQLNLWFWGCVIADLILTLAPKALQIEEARSLP